MFAKSCKLVRFQNSNYAKRYLKYVHSHSNMLSKLPVLLPYVRWCHVMCTFEVVELIYQFQNAQVNNATNRYIAKFQVPYLQQWPSAKYKREFQKQMRQMRFCMVDEVDEIKQMRFCQTLCTVNPIFIGSLCSL